jgi:hypothetical protein
MRFQDNNTCIKVDALRRLMSYVVPFGALEDLSNVPMLEEQERLRNEELERLIDLEIALINEMLETTRYMVRRAHPWHPLLTCSRQCVRVLVAAAARSRRCTYQAVVSVASNVALPRDTTERREQSKHHALQPAARCAGSFACDVRNRNAAQFSTCGHVCAPATPCAHLFPLPRAWLQLDGLPHLKQACCGASPARL